MPALKVSRKLFATLAVVATSGAILLWQISEGKRVPEPALTGPSEPLPNIALSNSDAQRITKIELTRPDDDDKSQIRTIRIEKQGQDWELTSPLKTRASTSKVDALINNLKSLQLWEVIDRGTGLYDQYDLTDAKALHIVAWKGAAKANDMYCGKTSPHGQFVRISGGDGIFSLVNWGQGGYQGFLYTRNLRSWRETSIFKFEEDAVTQVEITNRNGAFLFSKTGDKWTGSFTRCRGDGKPGEAEREWKNFDESKIKDLLRAYRSLSADDFGEEEDKSDSGVDWAEQTGGIVRIKLKDSASELTLRVGKLAKRTTRWAIKDSRWAIEEGGDGTLYVLSPWTAGWATADATRFEQADGRQRRSEPGASGVR
jgi:hypothetical protein